VAFQPISFEELAEEILKKIRDKKLENAKARTVVSRVYYACFLAAREKIKEILPVEKQRILKTGKLNGKRINVHYLVIETFMRSPDSNHKSIGDRLDELRTKRNNADYNLFYKINKPELEFRKAKQLREDIEAIQNKHLLSKAFSKVIKELK
jgi:uncharacterized protein (UPF0332 family)